MILHDSVPSRQLPTEHLHGDLVIVGGGIAGVCAAITAARAGIQVVLVQDRPVLGGNASSEIRLWILGATSHMGNNNRWAREGGVMDEILVENMWRNPEGNAILLDALLLELVNCEPNIRLLLNSAVTEVAKDADDHIEAVIAFSSLSQLCFRITGICFCDASGDGIVGFLAGASFRMGSESRQEFGELAAPEEASRDLLGDSLYFYSRDTGVPVKFVPPAFALQDISPILRHRELRVSDTGCRLWWLEYGGKLDTVHESEAIRWELWRVAYGVWNHIKNSGLYQEAETLTLEWMGTIPGKRESRRFEGLSILTQKDIVEQREHWDAVSFGGWAIDLHPADGVYSSLPGCEQWHAKGVYQIPFSTMVSRDIRNLMYAGRLISTSHIAFGSTRVMATCGHNAQAVGEAAALCVTREKEPREASLDETFMRALQKRLVRRGQWIPGVSVDDEDDLALRAQITASSQLLLTELDLSGEFLPLDVSRALLVPLSVGSVPTFCFCFEAHTPTEVVAELWSSEKPGNYIPEVFHSRCVAAITGSGRQEISFEFGTEWFELDYAFVILRENSRIKVARTRRRVTGVLSVSRGVNRAVAKSSVQTPPTGKGIDSMEFWLPSRRPNDELLSVRIFPPLKIFEPENITNLYTRPYRGTNAWVAAYNDSTPCLKLEWDQKQSIAWIILFFDTDFDHPMESVLMSHPERATPFCVRQYRLVDQTGCCVHEAIDNHQSRNEIVFDVPLETQSLELQILETFGAPAAVFKISCFGPPS